jgi:pimeloyl-ACP methyl ester carboxylesterase
VHSDDGVALAAYDFGGDGPPLLLAHATGLHAHTLRQMVIHLRATFHCYTFDERGHGRSEAPASGDFDWYRFADDARAVTRALGLERPAAFGHSCGGALLLLAEQTHPGSWAAIYGFEPVVPRPGMYPPDTGIDANPLAVGALKRRAVFPDRQAAYDNFAAKPPFSDVDPAALRDYVDHGLVDQPDGTVALACRPESEAATYAFASRHRAWDELDRVECPVTVGCGSLSTHFDPTHNAEVARRLPRGSVDVLDGLGHFGPMERPALVATSVLRALSGSE